MIMLSYVYDQVKKERAEFRRQKRLAEYAEGKELGRALGIKQGRAQRDAEVAALKARIAELERGRNGSEG